MNVTTINNTYLAWLWCHYNDVFYHQLSSIVQYWSLGVIFVTKPQCN